MRLQNPADEFRYHYGRAKVRVTIMWMARTLFSRVAQTGQFQCHWRAMRKNRGAQNGGVRAGQTRHGQSTC